MRGYRRSKESGNLEKISKMQRKLSLSSFALENKDFSSLIMGNGCKNFELVLRQYLILKLGYTNLRCAVLLAEASKSKRISYPLPKQWKEILEAEGYLINHLTSSVLWNGYVLAMFFYGVFKIFEIGLKGLLSEKIKDGNQIKYCYFLDLTVTNFQYEEHCGILSWYCNWIGSDHNITSIRHAVKSVTLSSFKSKTVEYQNTPIPNLSNYLSSIRYMLWGTSAITITLIDLFRGRWRHALLLNQAALSGLARNTSKSRLAKQYMFANSSWLYRPLWTYDAELKGCEIVLYFYSTNCEPFKTSNSYKPLHFGYESMSWSRYLVWDKYQEDFIRRAVGKRASIEIVGPINFAGAVFKPPRSKNLFIAVFDVTPFRASRYCMLSDGDGFHTPLFINVFLEHVSRKLIEHSYNMYWKRKRDIGKQAHPSYRRMQDLISQRHKVFEVQHDVSASSLIANSYAVISSPYTSTAVIAKEMGKPSIYYDPSKLLRKGDRAAHGIKVVQGELELDKWLNSLA